MSSKIDPREVLIYLNELGYTNITAEQLKEFIKDLKKLIKYDARYGGEANASVEEECYHEQSEFYECSNITYEDQANKENYNVPCSSEPKLAELAKSKGIRKEKHIAVHIYDTKTQRNVVHEHCIHMENINKDTADSEKSKLRIETGSSRVSKTVATESTIRSVPPNSSRTLSRTSGASGKDRKSKVAFIRPAISKPSINKSDPVALYHYYQTEWKTSKIPGQDTRDDLRWAIREKMLAGPRVEVRNKCNIQRCEWRR